MCQLQDEDDDSSHFRNKETEDQKTSYWLKVTELVRGWEHRSIRAQKESSFQESLCETYRRWSCLAR